MDKSKAYLFLLLFLLLGAKSWGQDSCSQYDVLIQQGDNYLHNGDYLAALGKYQSALTDCPLNVFVIEKKFRLLTELLDAHIGNFHRSMEELAESESIVEAASRDLDSLKKISESLMDSIDRLVYDESVVEKRIDKLRTVISTILSAVDLANTKATLATVLENGERKYVFINENGELIGSLGSWTFAEPFEGGYAIVEKNGMAVTIDSLGNEGILPASNRRIGLNFSYLNLWHIPSSVFQFDGSMVLLGACNRILEFPSRVKVLENLIRLDFADNRIRNIKALTHLHKVRSADFSGNRIRRLPRGMGELEALRELNLDRNRIRFFPEKFNFPDSLIHLHLGFNSLDSIDSRIFALKNLEELNLRGNEINDIPFEITELSQLKKLDLTGNCLSVEAASRFIALLPKLTNLFELRIGDNPSTSTPESRMQIARKLRAVAPNVIVFFN